MLASHTTFVQEHRQRLEHHIDRFSQWLESSSTPTPTDMVGLKAQLDTMCKDQALAHAQLEKELQATIQQLKSRVTLLGQELASCREAHVALRQQCEVRGLDVGQGSKAELSDVDPSAETLRLRKSISELVVQRDQLVEKLSTTGSQGGGPAPRQAMRVDLLERERAALLAAKTRAEEVGCWNRKLLVSTELITAVLQRAAKLQLLVKKYIAKTKGAT
eukprot:m.16218 g.16218  ORF g.16218 m.16218 type:complete len:218 (-) comp10561_c0_seq1:54-707(-)